MEFVKEAADFITQKLSVIPHTALVLGSGLGPLADDLINPVFLPYSEIPHFPLSTAPGHKGRLACGILGQTNVIAMQGRFHYYEGYEMSQVIFPIRVFKKMGITKLIVTNAAGGINLSFSPGDLMVITDHIKFGGDHPLRGPNNQEFGPRFNDMSHAYSPRGLSIARDVSQKTGVPLKEGVYAYMTGPSFETPAEIRMLRTLGADAVGMSTVPEVITASHCGLEVIGISCISNMAAGILNQPITEDEVIETGIKTASNFKKILETLVHDF